LEKDLAAVIGINKDLVNIGKDKRAQQDKTKPTKKDLEQQDLIKAYT